ncbi:bacillithiol biosynthesis deacetylase BshB1 [Emticicia soli]|uniref:Bacillithiol biosynthesis deacetylase BshB1 n=1 Tax=Emticicia soli TaxID=2027878 RepID=A0ABW5J9C1_9BACT
MKLDILVMAAHPDDAEMSAGGTMAMAISKGRKVGIVDFTRGELGTRGTPEIRAAEAKAASEILNISVRENLGFRDGFFKNDEDHQMQLIRVIRKYQPEIVLANAVEDRHPDHGKGAALAVDACFLSGLRMIQTLDDSGNTQAAWRPKYLYHYIQDRHIKPDFVVDISDFWAAKEASIRAYKSQFHDPESTEPESYLTSPEFMDFLKARSQEMGHPIGAKFGEGYTKTRMLGVKDLFDLI